MFRRALFFTSFLASPLWAADFIVQAPVLAAKVYPQGATLRRAFSVGLPEGAHRVLLPVPPALDPSQPFQIRGLGDLSLGSVELLPDYLLDSELVYMGAQKRAFDAMEDARERLEIAEGTLARMQSAIVAAEVQLEFLRARAGSEDGGLNAVELREINAMLGEEVASLSLTLQQARENARPSEVAVRDAQMAFEQAQFDFKRLQPPQGPVDLIAISLNAPEAVTANLTLSHLIFSANWRPSYDMNLNRAEGVVEVERKVIIEQQTGEIWSDIALSLSTSDPFSQINPATVDPNLALISNTNRRGAVTSTLPTVHDSRRNSLRFWA